MTGAFRPGDVLARRYRLVDLLVESGSGRFWRAHDLVLDRHVALHTIAADDARSQALLDAARASTAVADRRLLRVLDAAVDDDVCYVVNEWGSGVSLDILVGGGQVLAPRHAAWVVAQVADSVARAHAAGIGHGRLAPENVLVDRHGQVRVIGLCVDAALHGVPHDRTSTDVTDLAGLLYCALTASWAGASASDVRAAPVEHGHVLRPRRVRAGVPRPLDQLCDLVLHPHLDTRGRLDVTAAGIAERLVEFVGDEAGLTDALVATLPPVRERFPTSLPPVPEIPARPDPPEDEAEADTASVAAVADLPTEAALPAYDADEDTTDGTGAGTDTGRSGGSSGARRARRTPGPPPPRPPDPPSRPLFAPDPPDGTPVRRSRRAATTTAVGAGGASAGATAGATAGAGNPTGSTYWPWDTGQGDPADSTGSGVLPAVQEPVPGRRSQRVGIVIALLVLVLVAAVVAYNLGRGRTPLGAEPEASATPTPSAAAAPEPVAVEGLTASLLDPQGGGSEDDGEAPLAVDEDPATGWSTLTYFQQLGPGGLKTGLGLTIDLGEERDVAAVDLVFDGAPTSATVFTADTPPTGVDGLTAVASVDGAGPEAGLDLEEPVAARYLVVWLTALPPVEGGFSGGLRDVAVSEVPRG